MRLEARKYLHDIARASDLVAEFVAGAGIDDYADNAMLRAAVEREFEIIGEALAGLARLDEDLVSGISEYRRIIAFRNILIHGYAEIDDRLVWDIVESKLPILRREVAALIEGG
jgi:uncharacterized protein with HEPN domain